MYDLDDGSYGIHIPQAKVLEIFEQADLIGMWCMTRCMEKNRQSGRVSLS